MKPTGVACAVLLALTASMLSSCALVRDDWQPVRSHSDSIRGVEPYDNGARPPSPGPGTAAVPEGPLKITIEEAVLLAMENNRALRVERLTPPIQRTFEEQELAAFEPVLSAEVYAGREKVAEQTGSESRDTATGGGVAVSEFLPTGTKLDLDLKSERIWGTSTDEQHTTRAGLSVTQALLQGRGVAINLADLRQARLNMIFSDYELHGFAEALDAEV